MKTCHVLLMSRVILVTCTSHVSCVLVTCNVSCVTLLFLVVPGYWIVGF